MTTFKETIRYTGNNPESWLKEFRPSSSIVSISYDEEKKVTFLTILSPLVI